MEHQTPRELLHQFYLENNLPLDGGQSVPYVKIEVSKKISFYFPNFEARKKAVVIHDIHHLVTGYSAGSLAGESEISAWEIASGCTNYWAAFFINTSGLMIGIPFNFLKVLKSFVRGRRTKNFYTTNLNIESILDTKVSELRKQLHLDNHDMYCNPSFIDFILFGCFVFFGAIYSLLSLLFFTSCNALFFLHYP